MSTPSNLLSKNSLHGIISLKHKGEKCLERVKFACAKKISINSAKDRLLRIRDLLLNSIATTAENASMKRGGRPKGPSEDGKFQKGHIPPKPFPKGHIPWSKLNKGKYKILRKDCPFPGRGGNAYRDWKIKVRERDGNKCTKCGSTKKIHAHHIISWEENKMLRFEVDNGVLLCISCHNSLHKKGKKRRVSDEHI